MISRVLQIFTPPFFRQWLTNHPVRRVTTDEISDQMDQKNNHVPQELITEILLCSSVKTLLRFRCVSKSYCTFIDSNQFINLHRSRSAENKKHRKLIGLEIPLPSILHVFDVDSGLEEKINIPSEKSHRPYGYCNGLILLLVDSFEIALWSPSTQKYRNLPICPIEVPNGSQWSITGMGLGYDSTHDDYKVVLNADVVTNNNNTSVLQIWIFGLRSNLWRKIQEFPWRKYKLRNFGHFVDGCLHWMCKAKASEYALVKFDLEKETMSFYRSNLPGWVHQVDLHILDERLCFSYVPLNLKKVILGLGEKEGTKIKVVKLLTIPVDDVPLLLNVSEIGNVRVLGYTKEGDKVMLDFGSNFIVLFDLKGRPFETRKVVADDAKTLCNYLFLYQESLVSVGVRDSERQSGKKRKNRAYSHFNSLWKLQRLF